ncbi:Fructose-2,6-bisphosphatase [Mortierella claussenii]|nr:Fructose-2,6-bisphosphatase [Mortierella claussenii]
MAYTESFLELFAVCRYLQWLGITTKVFNVGNYRRKLFGTAQPQSFFDPCNQDGHRCRTEADQTAFKDMLTWFSAEEEEHGASALVAVYDATNTTRVRREAIQKQCEQNNVQVMFIESTFLENQAWHLAHAVQMQRSCPDYAQMEAESALEDYKVRVGHYARDYETMTVEQDRNLTFIKLVDAGSQVIVNQIRGYLQSRVVYYLMNLRIAPRNIYFSRHGESLYNVMGLLGGDSDLSARGKQYARALPSLIATHIPNGDRLTVWTSTKKRTIATARHLPNPKYCWKELDELEAGKADGLTYEQVEEQFPEDFLNRDNDKFNYRYQEGESYKDVVARLEPVIMNLERQSDILIIGHQAILRCLYAYFMNCSFERLPYIKIPLHTLIQLTPGAYKCEERRFKVDIEAVDTHRPKPKSAAAGQTANNGVSTHPEQQHPPHDDPLVNAVPTVLPSTATSTAGVEVRGKTLQSTAVADTPRIILSSLVTTTFRDAIHPTPDTLPKTTLEATVTPTVLSPPTITPTAPTPITSVNTVPSIPAPALAPVPADVSGSTAAALPPPVSARHEAPASIDLPPMEEKARLIAEALMQANAIGSMANPAVALNLDEIITPVPEQEMGGVKGPLLEGDTRATSCASSNINSDNDEDDASSVRSNSLETVGTPPMSPVPSKDDRRNQEQIGEKVAEVTGIVNDEVLTLSAIPGGVANNGIHNGYGSDKAADEAQVQEQDTKVLPPLSLPVNSQPSLAAACI